MNRKDFFKKLGIGIATVVVAPKVLAKRSSQTPPPPTGNMRLVETMTPEDILKTWKQTGEPTFHAGSHCVNDIVIYMGRKYMIVEKFAYTDLEWRYKLRPNRRGRDIEITERELRQFEQLRRDCK